MKQVYKIQFKSPIRNNWHCGSVYETEYEAMEMYNSLVADDDGAVVHRVLAFDDLCPKAKWVRQDKYHVLFINDIKSVTAYKYRNKWVYFYPNCTNEVPFCINTLRELKSHLADRLVRLFSYNYAKNNNLIKILTSQDKADKVTL